MRGLNKLLKFLSCLLSKTILLTKKYLTGLIGRPAKLARPDELMNEELREKLFALQNQVL